MAMINGSTDFADYQHYYDCVRSNPNAFVNSVLAPAANAQGPGREHRSGEFHVGKNTFKLTLVTNDKTQQLCIERKFEDDTPRWKKSLSQLMDALFFRRSTRSMEHALRSLSTLATGIEAVMRTDVESVMNELWPCPPALGPREPGEPGSSQPARYGDRIAVRPVSEFSLTHLRPLHTGEIDAWMRCPEGGTIGLRHIDRRKTRIEDDILVLSFKRGSDAVEFRLQASAPGERGKRDMQRLLSIATGERKGCDYRNMAELMGGFMVATIEDEAPRILEKAARTIVTQDRDNEVKALLPWTVNREPNRAVRRAIAKAVDLSMASLRTDAMNRREKLRDFVCRDKADAILWAALNERDIVAQELQQRAGPALRRQRLADFVRRVIAQRGVASMAPLGLHGNLPEGRALPDGVRLARFLEKPSFIDSILHGKEPRAAVLALGCRRNGEGLRFVEEGREDIARWAWKTIRLPSTPKDVEIDAKALHQTVFDTELGRLYEQQLRTAVTEGLNRFLTKVHIDEGPGADSERERLSALFLNLMKSVRIGNTTIGYLARWLDDPQNPVPVARADGGDSIVPLETVPEEMLSSQPISPRKAAAFALRQDLQHAMGHIANVTQYDVNRPVYICVDKRIDWLPNQFGADASPAEVRAERRNAPPVDTKGKNLEPSTCATR